MVQQSDIQASNEPLLCLAQCQWFLANSDVQAVWLPQQLDNRVAYNAGGGLFRSIKLLLLKCYQSTEWMIDHNFGALDFAISAFDDFFFSNTVHASEIEMIHSFTDIHSFHRVTYPPA